MGQIARFEHSGNDPWNKRAIKNDAYATSATIVFASICTPTTGTQANKLTHTHIHIWLKWAKIAFEHFSNNGYCAEQSQDRQAAVTSRKWHTCRWKSYDQLNSARVSWKMKRTTTFPPFIDCDNNLGEIEISLCRTHSIKCGCALCGRQISARGLDDNIYARPSAIGLPLYQLCLLFVRAG